ncbi:major facilitator superfamily MFS_1 (plasmid) [Gemmatirosa kalamazoonensis]|uniref:Major facilitator superfamily MFS_1 n=1 Tax=Gemmatirosa kalamazoonensis TaxID=861299 RepID=W0RR46_9BACT|nr:MFS transporter [Gemmatirosa kalamazoonensis]AHG93459.1 major facilitator superfamily MFS_1 [Gemmatirosa kalamazoonensis]
MHTLVDTPRAERFPAVGWALASLSLSTLLSALGTSVANVGLPTLARAFGASFQAVQWVVVAYLLAVTTLVVGVARLGDLVGRRRLLLAGIATFTAASLLCGLAPTLPALIAARAAQGLGAAVMMALTIAFVRDTVPDARTGSAMGLLGTMSALGTALGPSLGGVLIAGAGWRALFLVDVPLGIVALLLAYRHLPAVGRTRTTDRTAFARAGSAFPSMLRDRVLGARLVSNALVSTVMMATLVVGPFHLSRALGLTPALVGLALSVGPLVTAAAGVPAGRAADRFGTRVATLVGLGAMAVGAALACASPVALGIPGWVGPIAIVTVGYALFQTANNTAVMADAEAGQRGVVAGLLTLSRNLGLVSGASVMGAVFALASGATDVATAPPAAVATGMRVTFGVAAALIVVALAVSASARVRRAPVARTCANAA